MAQALSDADPLLGRRWRFGGTRRGSPLGERPSNIRVQIQRPQEAAQQPPPSVIPKAQPRDPRGPCLVGITHLVPLAAQPRLLLVCLKRGEEKYQSTASALWVTVTQVWWLWGGDTQMPAPVRGSGRREPTSEGPRSHICQGPPIPPAPLQSSVLPREAAVSTLIPRGSPRDPSPQGRRPPKPASGPLMGAALTVGWATTETKREL